MWKHGRKAPQANKLENFSEILGSTQSKCYFLIVVLVFTICTQNMLEIHLTLCRSLQWCNFKDEVFNCTKLVRKFIIQTFSKVKYSQNGSILQNTRKHTTTFNSIPCEFVVNKVLPRAQKKKKPKLWNKTYEQSKNRTILNFNQHQLFINCFFFNKCDTNNVIIQMWFFT